ncbi:MAG: hypothetical protein HOC74_05340 [Gemmatimonadetes bacterium]|jgi:hypothetical protein|nr:hypothetical protein [Gemmatimonadota bacterium]
MKIFYCPMVLVFVLLAGLALPGGTQAQVPEVGDVVTDFTLERLGGGEMALSDFSGRVVFINFLGYS